MVAEKSNDKKSSNEDKLDVLKSTQKVVKKALDKLGYPNEVYDLLKKHKICLAWSQRDAIQTPPEMTANFFYLRLIGDRSIDEKDFGTIQRDRVNEMDKWAKAVNRVKNRLSYGIVAANNNSAGFGPATANAFRNMVGLPEGVWEEKKQQTLGDF